MPGCQPSSSNKILGAINPLAPLRYAAR